MAASSEEVTEWVEETRLLMRAAELLVEWFTEEEADADEYAAFQESLDLPYRSLELVEEWLRVGDVAPDRVARWTAKPFRGSADVARAISPLLERIVRYEPRFVVERPEDGCLPKVVALWGQFIGSFGTYVCAPLWEAHPEAAPPGWRKP